MPSVLLVAPNFESDFSIARDMLNMGSNAPVRRWSRSSTRRLRRSVPKSSTSISGTSAPGAKSPRRRTSARSTNLIGVTGYQAHIPRAIEIARIGHKWGLPVVIGGPGVSGAPDVCRGIFDVIFLGEAELTWPRFLRDWQKGNHLKEYRQVERLDLAVSPVPRWDSVAKDISKYKLAAVQTTRGCPYDCDFCDVIHLFGRKPRHKPIENVLKEIEALQNSARSGFFSATTTSSATRNGRSSSCASFFPSTIPFRFRWATQRRRRSPRPRMKSSCN